MTCKSKKFTIESQLVWSCSFFFNDLTSKKSKDLPKENVDG